MWSRSSSFSSIRRSSSSSLTPQDVDQQAPPTATNVVARTASAPAFQTVPEEPARASRSAFGKGALSSMMDNISNLSSLSLTREKPDDRDRGRRCASHSRPSSKDGDDRPSSRSRTRSVSPFFRRRRRREPSPHVEALPQSDVESDTDSIGPSRFRARPRHSAFSLAGADDSASEGEVSDTDVSDDSWSDGDPFDDLTELNTERNSLIPPAELAEDGDGADIDPLGEGVNVVVPPEPLFPTTLHGGLGGRRNTVTRKRTLRPEHLPLVTSRPVFQRDHCTIRLTNGEPLKSLEDGKRKARRYVVASDLSMESKYAVEWCIGTAMRDGDEMIVVTVTEAENKRVWRILLPFSVCEPLGLSRSCLRRHRRPPCQAPQPAGGIVPPLR